MIDYNDYLKCDICGQSEGEPFDDGDECVCGGNFRSIDWYYSRLTLALSRIEELENRCREHEIFRKQHADCDAMGVENQQLRSRIEAAERLYNVVGQILDPKTLLRLIQTTEWSDWQSTIRAMEGK